MRDINPEILSDKTTHTLNGIKVKVFMSTKSHDGSVTFEYMEGPDKGKWSNNVKVSDLIPVETDITKKKLNLAIKAIEFAVARLEEIRYQKASDKQVKSLKEILSLIKE